MLNAFSMSFWQEVKRPAYVYAGGPFAQIYAGLRPYIPVTLAYVPRNPGKPMRICAWGFWWMKIQPKHCEIMAFDKDAHGRIDCMPLDVPSRGKSWREAQWRADACQSVVPRMRACGTKAGPQPPQ